MNDANARGLQGDAGALYKLGKLYLHGRGGVEQSDAGAVKYFRWAADQGHARSQIYLGLWYADGLRGVEPSDDEAVTWLRKAADQGHSTAQLCLGVLCENGRGGLDPADAAEWYRKAAAQGNANAAERLAKIGCVTISRLWRKRMDAAVTWCLLVTDGDEEWVDALDPDCQTLIAAQERFAPFDEFAPYEFDGDDAAWTGWFSDWTGAC